ncbi:hypothetical protein ACFQFH_07425 [Halobaculum halobium]|uniref:Uncharacterized protein n=1 Tax=Halobaculum halobium TaxID=3032281 RepID=A0ABD5TE55_9EURY|nr:hypothetical protein [Halobaculum sp. SYNS20]
MPQQVTFDSYAAAVATDVEEAWSPDERAATPTSADGPYGVEDATTTELPKQYTTFGCVEYRPRE